jgi:urocanate hydratase
MSADSMTDSRTQNAAAKPVRAPRGVALSCKGWQQEAALRLFMNCLDPAIAEDPERLIVSSGIGKLARDWPAFDAITKSLEKLADDETLLIQYGVPGPILKTNPEAPRVLVINAVPASANKPAEAAQSESTAPKRAVRMAADWMFTGPASALPEAHEVFHAAAQKQFGGTLGGRLVVSGGMGAMGGAQGLAASSNGAAFLGVDADANRIKRRLKSGYCEVMVNSLDEALRILKNAVRKRASASVGLVANAAELIPELARRGVLPDLLTDQTPANDLLAYIPGGLTISQAAELRERDPEKYRQQALDSIAAHVRGMLELKKLGSVVFEFGNGIRAQALAGGVTQTAEIPDLISEYLQPQLARGLGLVTLIALSGEAEDIARIDTVFAELFPDTDLQRWIAIARRRASAGLPARSCWIGPEAATRLGSAINALVSEGSLKAPVAIGCSICMASGKSGEQINIHGASSAPGARAIADSAQLDSLLRAASGAAWLAVQEGDELPAGSEQSLYFAVVADGKPKTGHCMARLFAKDFAAAFAAL